MGKTLGERLSQLTWGGVGYPEYLCELKGDHSSAEQASADALRSQEMNLMQQQLKMQMGQINSVNPILDQIIKNGGMMPSEESALTSLAINQLPQDFNNLTSSLNTQLLRRGITGGQNAGSGDVARGFGQLGAMEDFMKSTALSNIQLEKAQGLQSALSGKLQIGNMFGNNMGEFNRGGLGALAQGVTAAWNADQAATSWMGPFFGALGTIGGAGIGKIPGGNTGCWIAAELYGVNSPEFHIARAFIFDVWQGLIASVVRKLYITTGPWMAEQVRRHRFVRRIMRRLFDFVIKKALQLQESESYA